MENFEISFDHQSEVIFRIGRKSYKFYSEMEDVLGDLQDSVEILRIGRGAGVSEFFYHSYTLLFLPKGNNQASIVLEYEKYDEATKASTRKETSILVNQPELIRYLDELTSKLPLA